MKKKTIKKLIVPLAGMGTRFLPTSSAYPKEMAYLVDKPVLQYLVEEAYESGIREIVFIINKEKSVIQKYMSTRHHEDYVSRAFSSKKNIPKEYVDFQKILKKIKFHFIVKKKTLGDGHSILFAKDFIKKNEAFAVSMGDLLGFGGEPFIGQLIDVYNKKNTPVISVEQVSLEATSRFGVIAIKQSKGRLHLVKDIIEKPGPKLAPSRFILTGKYILNTDIFSHLERLVKDHKKGEVKLADALKNHALEKDLYAYECIGKIQDTGNNLDFLKTFVTFGIKHKIFGEEFKVFLKSLKNTRLKIL